MAIRNMVWACIACGREGTLQPAKAGEQCRECGALYKRARGAKISVAQRGRAVQTYSAAQLVGMLPEPGASGEARVEVQDWVFDKPLHALGSYLGRIDHYGEP